MAKGRCNKTGVDWSDPEQVREYQRKKARERYHRNREAGAAKAREYYRANKESANAAKAKWYAKNREDQRAKQRQRNLRLKLDALNAYSNDESPRCCCCGEDEVQFLCLDHENNDGAEHRKRVGSGTVLYAQLKRDGWPNNLGLRVACYNCNNAWKNNNGECPHDKKRT